MNDDEVIAWTKKYEQLRELMTKELGLADINDIRAAEARGYQQAITDLRDGQQIAAWLGLAADDVAIQQGAINYLRPAVDYLEHVVKERTP